LYEGLKAQVQWYQNNFCSTTSDIK
jgi:hypothetical protein